MVRNTTDCENAALLLKSNIPYTCGEDANSGRKNFKNFSAPRLHKKTTLIIFEHRYAQYSTPILHPRFISICTA